MQDAIRVLAGECTVSYEAEEARRVRGAVVTVVKPDDTVLVHDAGGYRPAAWLTRADTVRYARDADGFRLVAGDETATLRVESHRVYGTAHYNVSPAGPPVGDCPDCGSALVRDGGRVACVGCRDDYGLPRDATVLEADCSDCGLPEIAVERGARFEVCLDRQCDPLVERLRDRFDGEWGCPDCGSPLGFSTGRGIRATCPDCGQSLSIPSGTVSGHCDCGAPRFDDRCLDPDCPAP